MSTGYVHLFALPPLVADSGAVGVPQYQFTFSTGGNAFSRVFKDEEDLVLFLVEDLGLREDVLSGAMDDLHNLGKTSIGNVELSDNDAAAMGLGEVGADY